MNVELFLESLISPAIFTSLTLGLLIGAFYGFHVIEGAVRSVYPTQLWIVGIAWLATLAILAAFEEGPFLVEPQFARGILWTLLCAAIPWGRRARIHFETWRIERRRHALEE